MHSTHDHKYGMMEGSPSDVKNVDNESTNELIRYTIDGRVIKNSKRGLNIIKMNNGSAKKVIVK